MNNIHNTDSIRYNENNSINNIYVIFFFIIGTLFFSKLVKTWGRRRLLEREAVVLNWIIIYKTGQETYFGFYFWGPGIQLELVFGRVKKTF